jgi:hypothetical protein
VKPTNLIVGTRPNQSDLRIPDVDTDSPFSGVPYSQGKIHFNYLGDVSLKYKLAHGMRNQFLFHFMHSNMIFSNYGQKAKTI